MTIGSTSNKSIGRGNGATTVWPFSFLLPDAADLVVSVISAAGTITVLNTAQYTLSGVGNVNGGTVGYPISGTPLPTGASIVIERVVPYTQEVSLEDQGGYYPSVVEGAMDQLEMQIQQLASGTRASSLAMTFPSVDVSPTTTLPPAQNRASKVLGFDGNGNPVMLDPNITVFPGDLSDYTVLPLDSTTPKTLAIWLADPIDIRAYGAISGLANNTTAIQAALNAVPTTGGCVYFPPGIWKTSALSPKANTLILAHSGSIIQPISSGNNQLWTFNNPALATTNLVTGVAGSKALTVVSNAGFVAGDRIIVSGGTFTGSGVEEGPLEFNTVESVAGGATINVKSPLKYSYSAFGLPGAAPNVKRLGPETSIVRNVRIVGGQWQAVSPFNGLYFNFANAEMIECSSVLMLNQGSGIATGHNLSQFNFHDNICTGVSLLTGVGNAVGMNIASIVESQIVNNTFNMGNEDVSTSGQLNHLILEVTARDNLIEGNIFGPIRSNSGAAVEFTFYSFNNRIVKNRIWGLDSDVAGSVATLGIRTIANGLLGSGANIICENEITDIFQSIGDGLPGSVICNNSMVNATLNASSVGINNGTAAGMGVMVGNTFVNIGHPCHTNAGAASGQLLLMGNGTPAYDVGKGSVYLQKDATRQGRTLWVRDLDGAGNLVWRPSNQMPACTFAQLPAASSGDLFYVTDGTPGDPLTGGGSGCLALGRGASWVGLRAV